MLRFYMDEDSVERGLIGALRVAEFDVLTTGEAGNQGLPDDGQLSYAAAAGRAIVTANRKDFARLHALWQRAGRRHSGIIVRTRQSLTIGDQLRAIQSIDRHFGEGGLDNMVEYMTHWLTVEG